VPSHIDALASKSHAFGFEAQALLKSSRSAQSDLSSGTQNPVPGKSNSKPQDCSDLTGAASQPGGATNRAISGHHTPRNLPNAGENARL